MLNEKQYKFLCETCDDLLQEANTSIERTSNAWLHVLNEHPSSLEKYLSVFTKSRIGSSTLKSLIYILVRGLIHFKKKPEWFSSKRKVEKTDVIFVSHLLNESQVHEDSDFYFGNIANELVSRGSSSMIIYHNHTGVDESILSSKFQLDAVTKVLFPSSLNWKKEFSLVRCLMNDAKNLRNKVKATDNLLYKNILESAANNSMSSTSINALRFYFQVKDIVKQTDPKAIVVTYEGHAWERMAFAAARSINPKIRCIGYQHAILFPRQHALKRVINKNLDPDIILTAGDVSRDLLQKEESLKNIEITTVGTHRQNKFLSNWTQEVNSARFKSCLVIPDGNLSECLIIINFSIRAALLLPKIKFIIRMHPLVNFSEIVKLDKNLKKLPENVIISNASINKDFERCYWAIYRGSGAIIHAVISGLRPFYISLQDELNIDPLHDLTEWKYIVNQPSDLARCVNNNLNSNGDGLEIAQAYCKKYFMPVDKQLFCNRVLG